MTDLIHLQHCNAFQEKTRGVKTDWEIRKNVTGEVLFTLPSTLLDEEVFALLKNIRHHELYAFNAGIKYQKDRRHSALSEENEYLKNQIAAMQHHSDQLAERVESFTKGEA